MVDAGLKLPQPRASPSRAAGARRCHPGRAHTPWFPLPADPRMPRNTLPAATLTGMGCRAEAPAPNSFSLYLTLGVLPCNHGAALQTRAPLRLHSCTAQRRQPSPILPPRLLCATTINKLQGKQIFTAQGLSLATLASVGRSCAAAFPFSKSGHGEGRELASHFWKGIGKPRSSGCPAAKNRDKPKRQG